MKKVILLLSSLLFAPYLLFSYTPDEKAKLYANGYAGKKFVVSMPGNYTANYSNETLEIKILAIDITQVSIISEALGIDLKVTIPEGESYSLNTLNGPLRQNFENFYNRNSDYSDHTIHIESDFPVYVYGNNLKRASSDGLAYLPVESWGKDYIHNSFYVWLFGGGNSFGSGFHLISGENGTKIDLKLNGKGQGLSQTKNGYNIGDNINIKLDEEELYHIEGDSDAQYQFDLSGSRATSTDTPFSMISFHEITWLPIDIPAGNPLLESSVPVTSYGNEFVTQSFSVNEIKGDYFRVVASEDATDVTFRYYDPMTNLIINEHSETLMANEVWSPFETDLVNGSIEAMASGLIHISSSKPTMVYHYMCSAQWYDSTSAGINRDPMMFNLTSTDLWTQGFAFATPSKIGDNEFTDNNLILTFVGSESDSLLHDSLMNSIKIDGVALKNHSKDEIYNIPGTDYFVVSVNIESGNHYLVADTKVAGYMYGTSWYDSYGYVTGGNIRPLDVDGNIATGFHLDSEIIDNTDNTFDVVVYSDYKNKISQISFADELKAKSMIEEVPVSSTTFQLGNNQSAKAYRITRVSPEDDLDISYSIGLHGGMALESNSIVIEGAEPSEKVTSSAENLDFGLIAAGETLERTLTIDSHDKNPSTLNNIILPEGFGYRLPEGLELPIEDFQDLEIFISFTPTKESNLNNRNISETAKFSTSAGDINLSLSSMVAFSSIGTKKETAEFYMDNENCNQRYTFTLTNSGLADNTITDFYLSTMNESKTLLSEIGGELFDDIQFFPINVDNATIKANDSLELFEICFANGNEDKTLYIEPVFDTEKDENTDFESEIVLQSIASVALSNSGSARISEITDGTYQLNNIGTANRLEVIDIKGKSILINDNISENIIIDLNGQAKGIYIFVISGDSDSSYLKVSIE